MRLPVPVRQPRAQELHLRRSHRTPEAGQPGARKRVVVGPRHQGAGDARTFVGPPHIGAVAELLRSAQQ